MAVAEMVLVWRSSIKLDAVPGHSDWESEQRCTGERAVLCPELCSDWQTQNMCPTYPWQMSDFQDSGTEPQNLHFFVLVLSVCDPETYLCAQGVF